jgi:ElaB/YqjD/DUF883 family membrane-anchored ribosome-binding protein
MDTPNTTTTGSKSTGSPQPYQKFKNGMDSVTDKVTNKLSDKLQDFDLTEQYGMIKERAEDIYETSTSFVKRYPVSAILGATAVGFILSALVRRRD